MKIQPNLNSNQNVERKKMSEVEKNYQLLREVHKELRDMIHLKDDDMPSIAWEE